MAKRKKESAPLTQEGKLKIFTEAIVALVNDPELSELLNNKEMELLARAVVAYVIISGKRFVQREQKPWGQYTEKAFIFLLGFMFGERAAQLNLTKILKNVN